MNNKNLVIVVSVIVGVIILLGAGCFFGVSLIKEKTGPQIESLEKLTDITSSLSSSKLIVSIIAYGKVTNISGRVITLTDGAENLKVSIKENAQIYSFTTPVSVDGKISGAPVQNATEFKDIKVGDNLNVNMKMLADGQVEGLSVIIFSSNI